MALVLLVALLVLVASPVHARDSSGPVAGSLGIGVLDTDRFPGGAERRQRVIPVINITYAERYYFRFTQLGAWLWRSEEVGPRSGWRVGPALRPRFRISPPQNLSAVDREERDFSLDAGLAGELNGRWLSYSAAIYGDAFGRHNGLSARIGVSSFVPLTERLRVLPAISLDWESSRIGRFYYGTTHEPEPGQAWIPSASLLVQLTLTRRWGLTAGLFMSRQPASRQATGMLASRTSRTAVLGLAFRF